MYRGVLGLRSKVTLYLIPYDLINTRDTTAAGCRRFRLALYDMIGYYPSYFFVGCWAVITPLICSGVFVFKLVTWENLVYQVQCGYLHLYISRLISRFYICMSKTFNI